MHTTAARLCVTPEQVCLISNFHFFPSHPKFEPKILALIDNRIEITMAELLAVAGGISSFITIAEVALHLVQGCRQLIKDAKGAPEEVRKLVGELKSLSGVAEGIERIVRETENEELKTKVDEAVRAPLERCVGVVGGLTRILAQYDRRLQTSETKLWWEKVKFVKGKKAVARLLDDIERAKIALVLAHQNALSITAQSQGTTLDIISQNLNLSRNETLATAAQIDNSYKQGKEALTVAKSTQQEVHEFAVRQAEDSGRQKTIQTKVETISESQNQSFHQVSRSLERVHDSHLGLSTKIDNSLNQGETILTITKRSEETMHQSEKSRKEDSERLRLMERQLEQLSSVMGNPGILVGLVTEALDAHNRSQRNQVVEVEPDIDGAIPHSNDSLSALESSIPNWRRRSRWKRLPRKDYFWNRYFAISSTTRKEISDEDDLTKEHGLGERTETTFTVRSTLPFLKRALYYTSSGTAWDPLYNTNVRYTRGFTDDSAIWKACKACDVDQVRRLFVSGEASPFMEDERGHSLADRVIEYIASAKAIITDDHVKLVKYLVRNCGRGGASLSWYLVCMILIEFCLADNRNKGRFPDTKDRVASILRLVVEYSREDPLDHPFIPALIDLENSQDAIVTTLIQQPFWPLDLRPAVDYAHIVEENSRQILEDPEGIYIRELLEDANFYIIRTITGNDTVFAGLFELATQSATGNYPGVLRECCKNRMKFLISTPKYHRLLGLETLDFEDVARIRLEEPQKYSHHNVYVGGRAIRDGYRPLLEEVFHELGWNDFDVNDFFDKETFYSVPALLNGEINYETSQQIQQEFILNLCDGGFTGMTKNEIELLGYEISYTTRYHWGPPFTSTIEAANLAFVAKSTPGSWPEEGEIRLVPGVDFVVDYFCEEYIFSWYCDYVDPAFEFELSDDESESEYSWSSSEDSTEDSSSDEYEDVQTFST